MSALPHIRASTGRESACAPQNALNTSLLLRASGAILLMVIAAHVGRAGPVELSRQAITLPANAGEPLFVDIEGDGRCDLLVMDPMGKKLLNYHQRADGFSNAPDQVIPLPPDTAWVAACDVDAHEGLELLMSTGSGLVYARQNAGLFESERRRLIEARQVFTNKDFPILVSLSTNIPVISAGRIVLYHRNRAYEWSPGPPLALDVKQTAWSVNDSEWMMGAHPAHSLRVERTFLFKPERERDKELENEAIRKIMDDMKKNVQAGAPYLRRVDVAGDGREDLVLSQVASGILGFKTDVYIFLRGADQHLPERPTQVLHCRGFPIPIGSESEWSPVQVLRGDGVCELVLLEFKPSLASASGLVEAALSRGLDCSLTIRSFHRGALSGSPDASVPVTIFLADWGEFGSFPICIQGDFNGDGCPDLLVRRSETRWNIFFSTNDGRWFAPQPAMIFDAPARGDCEITNLNSDGLADIIWHEPAEHRLSIFMSPLRQAKVQNR